MKILSNPYIQGLREEVLDDSVNVKRWIPQEGFQEQVLQNDADLLIIGGRRGGGKMQPMDAKVLTPDGFVTMAEIGVGSSVINPTDGNAQRVTRVTDHKGKEIYRVYFSDGTSTECGMEHLWQVYIKTGESGLEEAVMTLEGIMGLPWMSSDMDIYVPTTYPVEFAPRERVRYPYLTGKKAARGEVTLDRSHLLAHRKDRMEIVRGISDVCGTLDRNGILYLVPETYDTAEKAAFLCRSLGFVVSEGTRRSKPFVRVRGPETWALFKDTRLELTGAYKPFAHMKRMTRVEFSRVCDARCIEVDGISPLYITDGFTVTHNSAVMLMAPARNLDKPNFSCIAFRKEESEIKSGLWKESKRMYPGIGRPKESDLEWVFPSGATIRFEHLQNENVVADRFRGVNITMVLIDEIQLLRYQTIFDLLASNRSSGIRCQFIGSCNPVDADHWLMKLIWWYINKEGDVIPERNGKKIYFYKFGEGINDIYFGETKEEVYRKAKGDIDRVLDEGTRAAGITWENMINSLCFIEGLYSQNKIFIKNDPNYVGNLIQQGGEKAVKDFTGKWGRMDSTGNCEISADDFLKLRTNPQIRTGTHYAVADVALSKNEFVVGAFDGFVLYDVEVMVGVGSETAKGRVREFLRKHHVEERNFAFDSDGIGQYLKEPFHSDRGGAFAFNNNSASSDRQVWYNLKSECIDKMILAIREEKMSVTDEVWDKKMPDGKTFGEHLMRQRKLLIKKTNTTKNQYIPKIEMKRMLGGGKSPDEMDMLTMFQIFQIYRPKGNYRGLSYLKL